MNLQLIKTKAEEIKYPGGFKGLAKDVGMTEQNLHRCVRENKIQAQDLERIAQALYVSVGYFFNEKVLETTESRSAGRDYVEQGNIEYHKLEPSSDPANEEDSDLETAVLRERVKSLETLIAEKDERIADLRAIISSIKH